MPGQEKKKPPINANWTLIWITISSLAMDKTKKTFECASVIHKMTPKLTTYTDLTGRFPVKSTRGSEYIFGMYDYDSNAILATTLRNRNAKMITNAWQKLHNELTMHGHVTRHFILDNECSADLKSTLHKAKKTFKRAPPNVHR